MIPKSCRLFGAAWRSQPAESGSSAPGRLSGQQKNDLHLTDRGPDFTEMFLAIGPEIYGCYASTECRKSENCDEAPCHPDLFPWRACCAISSSRPEVGRIQRHGVRSAAYARL